MVCAMRSIRGFVTKADFSIYWRLFSDAEKERAFL
jgi:hypothetical protein